MKPALQRVTAVAFLAFLWGCAALRVEEAAPPPPASVAGTSTCCPLETTAAHHLPRPKPDEVRRRYAVQWDTEPARPLAGAATRLHLRFGESAGAGSELGARPEIRPHFLILSENLEEVHHFHPEDLGDWRQDALFEGKFTVPVTFRQGGAHWVVLEFVDRGALVRDTFRVEVSGPPQSPTRWNLGVARPIGGLQVQFQTVPDLPRKGSLLNGIFRVTTGGKPVEDLDNFGGVLAHVVLVPEGGAADALHLHGGGEDFGHFRYQNYVPGYRGPKIYFSQTLQHGGLIRVYLLLQRAGERYVVPFDMDVQEREWEMP